MATDFAFQVKWLSTHSCVFTFWREHHPWADALRLASYVAVIGCLLSSLARFTPAASPGYSLLSSLQPHAERCTLASLALGLYSYRVVKRSVVKEELTVTRGIGLEWRRYTALNAKKPLMETVPQCDVRDILINEGYQNFNTVSYLLILANARQEPQLRVDAEPKEKSDSGERIIVVFKYSVPPLEVLLAIRQCAKELMLLDEPRRGK